VNGHRVLRRGTTERPRTAVGWWSWQRSLELFLGVFGGEWKGVYTDYVGPFDERGSGGIRAERPKAALRRLC
jgi:hypothetical protein